MRGGGARQLYPEWPLAAARGVDRDLIVEVAAALMRINASHPAVAPPPPARALAQAQPGEGAQGQPDGQSAGAAWASP